MWFILNNDNKTTVYGAYSIIGNDTFYKAWSKACSKAPSVNIENLVILKVCKGMLTRIKNHWCL